MSLFLDLWVNIKESHTGNKSNCIFVCNLDRLTFSKTLIGPFAIIKFHEVALCRQRARVGTKAIRDVSDF